MNWRLCTVIVCHFHAQGVHYFIVFFYICGKLAKVLASGGHLQFDEFELIKNGSKNCSIVSY